MTAKQPEIESQNAGKVLPAKQVRAGANGKKKTPRRRLLLGTPASARRTLCRLLSDYYHDDTADPRRFRATLYGLRTLLDYDNYLRETGELAEIRDRLEALTGGRR